MLEDKNSCSQTTAFCKQSSYSFSTTSLPAFIFVRLQTLVVPGARGSESCSMKSRQLVKGRDDAGEARRARGSLPPLRSQCHRVVTPVGTTGRGANNTRPITQQGGSPSLVKHEGKAQLSKSLYWNTAHSFNLLLSFLLAFIWSFFLKEEDLYLNMSGTIDVWKCGTKAILRHTAWSQQSRKA